jgi:hypothetical protein
MTPVVAQTQKPIQHELRYTLPRCMHRNSVAAWILIAVGSLWVNFVISS